MGISTAQINAAVNSVFGKDIFAFAERLCAEKDSYLKHLTKKVKTSNGNKAFLCPCGHDSGKFQISEDGTFGCFVCGRNGKTHGAGMLTLAASAFFQSVSEGAREAAAEKLATWPEIDAEIQKWKAAHKATTTKPKPKKINPAEIRRKVYFRALTPKSKKGFKYAAARGIRPETLGRCRVAFFDGSELDGFSEEELVAAGLKKESQSGRGTFYVMGNRLGIPTGEDYSLYGRHINPAWKQPHNYCGRVTEAFGAKDAMEIKSRGGVKRLFIVESPFDRLSFEQLAGDAREPQWCTISTFGTRGVDGDDLVQLVKKIAPQEAFIVPDHDEWFKEGKRHAPGQAAALRRADSLAKAGVNVRLVVLPRGMDPNDTTAKLRWDVGTFRKEVSKALTPLQYRLWYEAHWFMGESTTGGAETAFVRAAAQIVREHYQTGEIPSVVARFVAKLARLPIDDAGVEEVRLVMTDILKSKTK